jgi:hypothetical protein
MLAQKGWGYAKCFFLSSGFNFIFKLDDFTSGGSRLGSILMNANLYCDPYIGSDPGHCLSGTGSETELILLLKIASQNAPWKFIFQIRILLHLAPWFGSESGLQRPIRISIPKLDLDELKKSFNEEENAAT